MAKDMKHKDRAAEIVCYQGSYQGSFTNLGRRRPPKTLVVGTARPHPGRKQENRLWAGPPRQGSALFSVQSGAPPPGARKRETLAPKSTAQPPVLSELALWRKTMVVSMAQGTQCRLTGNCGYLRSL